MDSLRYWVTEMHIDGFRFDLATTLTGKVAMRHCTARSSTLIGQDPVLAPVKMIAEPWDTAGYQVGGFPADWSEWNGKYRDDVRDFWHGADGVLSTVSQRVLGSPDVYEAEPPVPAVRVNFITAHDGFTLADLTAYAQKHNAANGEDNNDGRATTGPPTAGPREPTDERSGQRAAGPQAAQFPRDLAAVGRGADDPRWRRLGRPGRQQQRPLPGRRTVLVRLASVDQEIHGSANRQ